MENTLHTTIGPRQNPVGITQRFVVTAILFLPSVTWLVALGNPVTYFHFDLPPGQVPYILAKLVGLYVFVLLWLQVMLGLLQGDPLTRGLVVSWSIDRHRLLGITTLLAAWAHFLLFFSAVSLRKDTIAYDLLLPELDKGIYFVAVSLGWFALAGLNLVALTGLLRRRSGGLWALAHRLSLAVFAVALVHAQMIGSEAKGILWFAVHLCFAALVFLALFRRFVLYARTSLTASNAEEKV